MQVLGVCFGADAMEVAVCTGNLSNLSNSTLNYKLCVYWPACHARNGIQSISYEGWPLYVQLHVHERHRIQWRVCCMHFCCLQPAVR